MTPGPAARVACLVVLSAGIATAPLSSTPSRVAVVALVVLALGLARPKPSWFLRRLLPALASIAALLTPLFWSTPERAVEAAWRALGAASVAVALAKSVPLPELGAALSRLGVPRPLASAVHSLLWQLEHVGAEGRRLILARQLRGARHFGPEVLAQLLVRTTARAERVDLAMRLRGADGGPSQSGASIGAADVMLVALALALAVGLHVLGRSAR